MEFDLNFLDDFVPSDDESVNEKLQNYPKFEKNSHDKFWFRTISKENQTDTAKIEIDLLRVADHFEESEFDEAVTILKDLRENTKNNRTHEIMLIDSILQCYIGKGKHGQLSKFEIDTATELLSQYETLLIDFGDQIQFLRTRALFLTSTRLSKFKNDFRETMALLCGLCGSFENWQLFESDFINDEEMFGVKTKMEKILKYEVEHSKGFVRDGLLRKLEKIRSEKEVLRLKIGDEKVALIQSHFQKEHHQNPSDSVPSSEFRAHDSRSKNKLIPKSEQSEAVFRFRRQFPIFNFS